MQTNMAVEKPTLVRKGARRSPKSKVLARSELLQQILAAVTQPRQNSTSPAGPAGKAAVARLLYPMLSSRGGESNLLAPLREWVDAALPEGRVTFLLGDIEGSTRLWEQCPDGMAVAMERRDELVAEIVHKWGGFLPRDQGEGDSFFAVFEHAADAVRASLEIQSKFAGEQWPAGACLRLRVGIHSGIAQVRNGNYYGVEVNRCARIRSLARGGQIFVSRSTAEEVGAQVPSHAHLLPIGEFPLKDLSRPEEIFQLTTL